MAAVAVDAVSVAALAAAAASWFVAVGGYGRGYGRGYGSAAVMAMAAAYYVTPVCYWVGGVRICP